MGNELPRRRMFQRACAWSLMVLLVAGCSPELLPVPVTAHPTSAPSPAPPEVIGAPSVAAPGLMTIHMLDENSGWGLNDTAVLRTSDGGVAWQAVSPTGVSGIGYAVTSDFLDLQHAWILIANPADMLSGTLYRTADGGASWSQGVVPFGGGALHFLDFNRGWMMASLGAGAGSMAIAVFQTSDGGLSWTQSYVNDPTQADAGDSLPLGGLKDGLTPIDMGTAWIGGVTYAPGVVYLYQTRDGGHTWSASPVKIPAGYEEAELETTGPIFASSKTAYLPVHVASQNGVMLAIYISRDSGASWLVTPTFIPQGGSVNFVSEQAGFVWNGTDFYATRDEAQTWATVTPDVKFSDTFSGMDFVTARVGFVLTSDASGARGLYRTDDGGATWSLLGK